MTDRNGTVHTYSYDVMGRQTADAVTTLGSGVDGTIRRLTTAYDTQGNPYLFTAYDASSGGSIVNQVKRDFNGLGQLTSEWQSHSGAVTGSSSRVQYAYSEMAGSANHSRLTSMTYASGYAVNYNYASGLDSNISRLSSLSDSSNTLEAYTYLGLGTVVKRAHSQPGVDLTYIKLSTESTGDAGDQYTGLDRFGRVVDQRWINGSNTDVDRYQYGYDRDGNRLYKDNKVLASLSEVYTYDSLNQIASYKLGTLNGTKTDVTGSPSNSQSWAYDAVGNWDSITTNSTTQTRSANKQNEITAVSGATTPTYDNNGNLTTDENNYRFVYDAWNRQTKIKDSSEGVISINRFDGLNRKIQVVSGTTTTDRVFSSGWQLLEENVESSTSTRNIWSPTYVDALVLRDRDTDNNGSLDERLFALQDANYNVTGIANTSGLIQERYTENPFGAPTFRDASGSNLGSSTKAWMIIHQGGQLDIIGNYDFRNRVFSPTLGRWLTSDPIKYEGGDFNLYRYILNNPMNFLDSTGLKADQPCSTCGPDVSIGITIMDNWVKSIMLVMDKTKKMKVCASMFSASGWDVPILAGSGPILDSCPSGAGCKRTVTIDGKCFDSFAVNYYLFGLLNKLCGNSYSKGAGIVVGWSNWMYSHGPGAKSVWYCKGYYGRTSSACNYQPDHSRSDCELCSKVFTGRLTCHFGTRPSVTIPAE